jgi:hypothetical protein
MDIVYRAPTHPGMEYPSFVEPKPPRRVQAPAEGGASVQMPRVDEHVVRPETREELVRGRAVMAMPAKALHAERHFLLDHLAGGVLAPGYVGATDLLTRAGPGSDFATDTCIRREGIDPATGVRYLEELAFEVIGEQSLRDITERAEDLSARGVRRIIAIFAKKNEVREWSRERNDWVVLDPESVLDDRTLVTPVPVRALLDRATATRAVVEALYAKQEPAILAIEEKGREEGIRQGIEALCTALGIPVDAERRATIRALDGTGLAELLVELGTERRWP